MSAFVRLSSKLPGDPETNGVDALSDALVKDPARIRYGVVWFDAAKVTEDTDTGDVVPTMRVRRIEPIGEADAVLPEIARVVEDAVRARTGRAPIPFAIVEVGEEDPDQLSLIDDDPS
jgi:hypothetical protein